MLQLSNSVMPCEPFTPTFLRRTSTLQFRRSKDRRFTFGRRLVGTRPHKNIFVTVPHAVNVEGIHELSKTLIEHVGPAADTAQHHHVISDFISRLAELAHHSHTIAHTNGPSHATNDETFEAIHALWRETVDGVAQNPPLSDSDAIAAHQAATMITDSMREAQAIDPDSFNSLSVGASGMIHRMAVTLGDTMDAATKRAYSDLGILIQHVAIGIENGNTPSLDSLKVLQEVAASVPFHSSIDPKAITTLLALGIALLVVCSPLPTDHHDHDLSEETTLEWITAKYDPCLLAKYWEQRPAQVLARQASIGSQLMIFLGSLFVDCRLGNWEKHMGKRSKEFREIVESMGPAFIKVFQALSTRGDMFPEPWLNELKLLHDQVTPFKTSEALEEIERGLGTEWYNLFQWLSEEPLASASLGQVYHGLLRKDFGGGEVAVKVQRPEILESIALDCFLLRKAAYVMTVVPNMRGDWENLFDGWAERFFEELDYTREARHAMIFKSHMEDLPNIVVPYVYTEFSSRKILTTEWIHGEKLSETSVVDPRAVCRSLLNSYLVQLLEVGFLHADPHPGNLICTNDGKICFIDFGLVTEVTDDQKFALLEFITHLWLEDWSSVAGDLQKLEFLPSNTAAAEFESEELKMILRKIFGDMVHGGGLNISGIVSELNTVARKHSLVVPPYFTLILRTFCIIEGIAMQISGEFAIIQECLPYLASRLLKDDNPRTHALLRTLLYTDGRLDVERVQKLCFASGAFTLATSSRYVDDGTGTNTDCVSIKGENPPKGGVLDETLKEAVKVVFSTRGSYAQQILVDELVTAVEGMSPNALGEATRMIFASIAAAVSVDVQGSPSIPSVASSLSSALQMVSVNMPRGELSAVDEQLLKNFRVVLRSIESSDIGIQEVTAFGSKFVIAAGELTPMLPEIVPGLGLLSIMFLKELLRRKAQWIANELGAEAV
ncbi:hypothetical protein BSKO_00492 [Bryopsis sp. KO-2023]|nr:hypothetical protein BSKO_00492 [Bryopsis sp. KO-2023]